MEDLLKRLEALTEQSQEVDAEIWRAFGGSIQKITEVGNHSHWRWIDKTASGGLVWTLILLPE